MTFKAHWWGIPNRDVGTGLWYAMINGVKTEVFEWTGHDPNDGWKPSPDAIYLGYGELVEAPEPLDKLIPALIRLANAGEFTTEGLPNNSWEG